MVPGFYLRQVQERSLTNSSADALLCQYLNIYPNQSLSLSTVVYIGGETCVSNTAPPVIMETLEAVISSSSPINLTIPLSDDTRSDILGAFSADPTDETFLRSVNFVLFTIQSTSKGYWG